MMDLEYGGFTIDFYEPVPPQKAHRVIVTAFEGDMDYRHFIHATNFMAERTDMRLARRWVRDIIDFVNEYEGDWDGFDMIDDEYYAEFTVITDDPEAVSQNIEEAIDSLYGELDREE